MSEVLAFPVYVRACGYVWDRTTVEHRSDGVEVTFERQGPVPVHSMWRIVLGYSFEEIEAGEPYMRTMAQWLIEDEMRNGATTTNTGG